MEGEIGVIEQGGRFYVVVISGEYTRIVGPAPSEAAARQFMDELASEMAADDGEIVTTYDRNETKQA